jgi:hypothetical protein
LDHGLEGCRCGGAVARPPPSQGSTAKEPYINHLLEVATLVAEATEGTDPNLVIVALLHDAIEIGGDQEQSSMRLSPKSDDGENVTRGRPCLRKNEHEGAP